MTNRLVQPGLPETTNGQAAGIDSKACEKIWLENGRKPEHLSEFLKLYPVGYYLSWVQTTIGEWYATKMTTGDESNIKLLGPGLDAGKKDSGLRRLVIDSHIYYDANRLCQQKGYKLELPCYDNSVFLKLEKLKRLPWKRFFDGKKANGKIKSIPIAAKTIMERYYRFDRFWTKAVYKKDYPFRNAMFIDGAIVVCGPTRIELSESSGFGFWLNNNVTGKIKGFMINHFSK